MSLNFLRENTEFVKLKEAIRKGEKVLHVTGVIEPVKPYFLALILQETGKKVVFIRTSSSSLSQFEEECQFFLSQFGQKSQAGILPPLSENPYDDIPLSLNAVSSRMNVFYRLLHDPPALILTSLPGLLKPFLSPENLPKAFLEMALGERLGREHLLLKLKEFGYTQEDVINSPGEYAWRGGIVDVFSPWENYPSRVEFSGDEVVSIREFDISTQRSLKKINNLCVPSLREFPGTSDFLHEWENIAFQKKAASELEEFSCCLTLLEKGDYIPSFAYLSLLHGGNFVPFFHYLKDYLFIIDDFDEVKRDWEESFKDLQMQFEELQKNRKLALAPEKIYPPAHWENIMQSSLRLNELIPPKRRKKYAFHFQSVPQFKNRIPFFLQYLKKLQDQRERCFIFLSSIAVRQKLVALLEQHEIPYVELSTPFVFPSSEASGLLVGDLPRGFHFPEEKILYFSEKDIFTEERVLVSRRRVRPFLSTFQDLKSGNCVVHTDYGIGIFMGLIKVDVEGNHRECIEIHYKDGDKLLVPVESLDLVQKYAAVGAGIPLLNKLGTPAWEKTKAKTKKAIEKIVKELLNLYAQRKAAQGYSFGPSGAWQADFEQTFEHEETEDQQRAIREVMSDMESDSPMDRLLCGDVGYGKTEVALRASFKAVMDGKQVAVLCPTTVLASQHLKTFRDRLVLFPIRVEGLTRLQSRFKQKKIVQDMKKGLVDIVIGTHRILSNDVQFKDLGLLVVDEEQRFGVHHKEKIKTMKTNIDVLTMTATPIPRTLNLSLAGLRDISLIETPPKDRLAIHTVVTTFSPNLIGSAIKKELARGGQVYFIHNRIEDIEKMAHTIQKWAPQAKVAVVHGQVPSIELERKMIAFIEQKCDVLVSTTIIENGIDIPLVNTLIVNQADHFGLAQLYQLRGRVGRSTRQAVAYFLVSSQRDLAPLAKERLKALQEFSELGAGFRLAARDLEIRGAGNFLGREQHGNLSAVGFDYYTHLLEKAVKELKGEKSESVKSEINLKLDYRIPEDYLPQLNLRLNLYKRISSVESLEEIEKIEWEIKDRYGPLPHGVRNLLRYGNIKHLAQRLEIESIDRLGRKIIFKFFPTSTADLNKMTRFLEHYSGSLTPQGVMSFLVRSDKEEKILDETIIALKELSSL